MAPAHGEYPSSGMFAMASMSGNLGAARDDTVGMFASYGSYGSSRSSRSGRIPSSDFTSEVDIISTNSSNATTVSSGGFGASHDGDFIGSKSARFPSDLPPFFPSYSNHSRSPNRSPARTSSSPVHLPDNVPRFGAFCGAATGQSGELRLGGGDYSSRPSSAGGSPLGSPSPQPPPRLSGEFFRDATLSNGVNGPYPSISAATTAFYRDPTLSGGNCNSGPLPRIPRDTSRTGSPFGGSPLASATNSPRNFSRSNSGSGAAGGARIAIKEPTFNSKGMSLSAAISMSHKEQVQRWSLNHALPQQVSGATSGHPFPASNLPDAQYSHTQVHGVGAEDGGTGACAARSGASEIAMRSLHGRRTSSGMMRMTGGCGGGGGGGGYGGFSTLGSPDNLLFPPHSALPLSAGTSPDHPHFVGAAASGGIGRSHLAGGEVVRSHSLLRTSNCAGPTRSESKDDLTLLMDARARNKLGAQGDWAQSGSRSPDSRAFSASSRGIGSGSFQPVMDFRPYNGAASAATAAGAGVGGGGMRTSGGGKGAFSGALSMDLESDLAGVSLTESDCVPVGGVLHSSCVGNTAIAAATARGGEGTGEGENEEELSLVPCLNWEAVEALCLDMELDRRRIEAIHILHSAPPAPASPAAQPGAGAGTGAGGAAGAGGVSSCSSVDPPVLYALQFAGADEWYWPGCGGLLGATATATVA